MIFSFVPFRSVSRAWAIPAHYCCVVSFLAVWTRWLCLCLWFLSSFFHHVVPALYESYSGILQWNVLVFYNIGSLFVALWRFVVEFVCLKLLLWLSLCKNVDLCLFPTHSLQILVLNYQLFRRICRFLNKVVLLTSWDVGVFFRIPNCPSFVLQVFRTLFLHIHWVFQGNLKAISCWGQKWLDDIYVLLRLVIFVWRTLVRIWWVRLQVFIYCWYLCFQTFVVLLYEMGKKKLNFHYFWHSRFHLKHSLKKIFEQFEFLFFSVEN